MATGQDQDKLDKHQVMLVKSFNIRSKQSPYIANAQNPNIRSAQQQTLEIINNQQLKMSILTLQMHKSQH